MAMKVSVIIPVYNAERYLPACIESLQSQTLRDCEFIFVNDGSRDNSKSVVEAYQAKDGRIKLLNQENQGASAARNCGLRAAAGEYVGFVDADDFVEGDMFEALYKAARRDGSDAVICQFTGEAAGKKTVCTYPFPTNVPLDEPFIRQQLLPYLLRAENLNTVVNKIFKRKLIDEYGVEFPQGVALGEDGMFNMRAFSHAKSVTYLDYAGYHYREVAGSATRSLGSKDYFASALETYRMELPSGYAHLAPRHIQELRSVKLIHSVMSYIHMYFAPTKEMSFTRRLQQVVRMVTHTDVREALGLYWKTHFHALGRYEKWIVAMIRGRFALGLWLLTAYSRLRNR